MYFAESKAMRSIKKFYHLLYERLWRQGKTEWRKLLTVISVCSSSGLKEIN